MWKVPNQRVLQEASGITKNTAAPRSKRRKLRFFAAAWSTKPQVRNLTDGEENCDGNDPGSSGNTQNLDVFLAHRKGNCLYPKFEFLGGLQS